MSDARPLEAHERREPLLALDEARRHVLEACRPLGTVVVATEAADGLVLAEPVVAARQLPPFTSSSMDGYAVRSEDCAGDSARLRVLETIFAGSVPSRSLGTGEASRIMTGAPLPAGADAVCMVERTMSDDAGATVQVSGPVPAATNVRYAGEDVGVGDLVANPGTVLSPSRLGLFVALGLDEVRVVRRPRVAVASTGDELVGAGELREGAIRDSNRPALLALVRRHGFEAVDAGTVPDDAGLIEAMLDEFGSSCDAILTTGGVSVGDKDLVHDVLAARCDPMRWMQVAIKPAKPFAFGLLAGSRVPLFGLPGNPLSAIVSFELLVLPALDRLAGRGEGALATQWALTDEALERNADGKLHLVSVRAFFGDDRRVHVVRSGPVGSHRLAPVSASNAFALVPDGPGLPPGAEVEILVTDPDGVLRAAGHGADV